MPSLSKTIGIFGGIVSIASVVLTILGAIRLHTKNSNYLPISSLDAFLALILPIVQLVMILALIFGQKFKIGLGSGANKPSRQCLSLTKSLLLWILFALDVVLVSTSGYALDYDTMDCNLQTTWVERFSKKDVGFIRGIQDRFECCGLRSTQDRAWPFPDQEHEANACILAFGRDRACMDSWRGSAQSVLTTFVVIGLVNIVLKTVFAFIYWSVRPDDWSLSFGAEASRNDPARRRLLDQDDRSGLRVEEGIRVQAHDD